MILNIIQYNEVCPYNRNILHAKMMCIVVNTITHMKSTVLSTLHDYDERTKVHFQITDVYQKFDTMDLLLYNVGF